MTASLSSPTGRLRSTALSPTPATSARLPTGKVRKRSAVERFGWATRTAFSLLLASDGSPAAEKMCEDEARSGAGGLSRLRGHLHARNLGTVFERQGVGRLDAGRTGKGCIVDCGRMPSTTVEVISSQRGPSGLMADARPMTSMPLILSANRRWRSLTAQRSPLTAARAQTSTLRPHWRREPSALTAESPTLKASLTKSAVTRCGRPRTAHSRTPTARPAVVLFTARAP
ncbi:MAG: hypothetical protein ACI855_001233 [Myxococcota bacterium]|jgi:hypothetical protein